MKLVPFRRPEQDALHRRNTPGICNGPQSQQYVTRLQVWVKGLQGRTENWNILQRRELHGNSVICFENPLVMLTQGGRKTRSDTGVQVRKSFEQDHLITKRTITQHYLMEPSKVWFRRIHGSGSPFREDHEYYSELLQTARPFAGTETIRNPRSPTIPHGSY